MEDAHIATECDLGGGKKGMLFGVFDGHGGKEVALFAEKKFKDIFIGLPNFKSKDYETALKETFFKLDDLVKNEDYGNDTGTTACVVFMDDA